MLSLPRSVWDEPRPPNPPLRVWRDWALVGVIVPVAVLEGVLRPDLPWRVVSVIVAVALVPTLLWRRSRPLLMVAICFVTTNLIPLLVAGSPSEMYVMAYMLILPYSLFRWGSGREAVIGLTIMITAACLSMVSDRTVAADVVGAFAVMLSAITLGVAFRYRARARMRELDQVKLLEREQLARDLHDTVAHHVSAMAIRAQAGLATSASRPNAATEALHVIEAEASRALAEMRAMVRVLRRDQPADLEPGRGIADLEQLADRTRSGPSVNVEISGDLDDLPPSVGAAVYRLAQESVTNARRHARHVTRIEVRVAADDTSVHLRVSDDGDSGSTRPAASPGYGLIGMIERADLLGGTCEAGPNPGRGWTVTAVLPRTGSAT
ncbi:sensor histidine kinase [Streptosporangium sp. 'caverna']|uniref:sensor histidine kinase n=1 Tax=Streptosporangium sp. 'caverna' TaxID=2202249 RepID=UPI000D7D43DF|nr:sensor histidine kinase [Streptosporangium sp. 'caverna']AWS40117.1 two-component sensor histidine kinase [Streptosporangium sp. 'caverna']